MGAFDDSKPTLAMLGLQFSYAIVSLITRAALIQGMSPRVFVVYRQAIATVVIVPVSYFSRRKSVGTSLGLRSFCLVFLASLIGVTINQNVFAEGLYLASSSMASAMGNLVPAITFVMAVALGLEKIKIGSIRSFAKIVGTVICVSGAISMALLRGPKLLNKTIFMSGGEDWLLGCLFIFVSTCCWSIWLILQVPLTASSPDHLSLSAWMCFLATLQSGILTLFLEKDLDAWKLHSYLELVGCLFTGTIGSGLSFFVQAWVICQRGPLFSAMFNPLCTVIVTVLAAIFLHEEIYTGGRKSVGTSLGLRSFSLVFSASLIGVTINQNVFAVGLYLASSSMASAMGNLVPAITFVMAVALGLERIKIGSFRSTAKIVGTVTCVSGAISMALLRGPKLLNKTIFGSGGEDWLLGCLFIFVSTCCWSIWLILQVPLTASYPDHLSLSAWMCFLATLQSGILTLFLEKDLDAWKLHSYLELVGCLFTGIIGSGLSFFVQAWVICQRGPLFSAMFNPLCTVIVTVLAAIFLHEEIYTGGLIGGVAVIIGLYIVLWGKAKDFIKEEDGIDQRQAVKITIQDSREGKLALEEPFLSEKSNDIEEDDNLHQ
ncbi:hypothetical protein NC651_016492 [Populus alba x Populus x berolinensis]|nr:hypothetical protein NC651_016492 [Populus alba x Populus x berolinensis]